MKEIIDAIVQIVQQLGFPVAVSILAFWYIKYREDKNDTRMESLRASYDAEIKDAREMHRDETAKLTEAINNNTLIITQLYERMAANDDK